MNKNFHINMAVTECCRKEIEDGGILCAEGIYDCTYGLDFHVDFFNPSTRVTRRISVDSDYVDDDGYTVYVKNIRVYPVEDNWEKVEPCAVLYEVKMGSEFYVPYAVYREAAKKRDDRSINRLQSWIVSIHNPKAREVALRLAQKKGIATAADTPSQVRFVYRQLPEAYPCISQWRQKTNWVFPFKADDGTRMTVHFFADGEPVVDEWRRRL